MAERIILDLAPKFEKLVWITQLSAKTETKERARAVEPKDDLREDLTSALQNLGYQPTHIRTTLDRILEKETKGFEVCLKAALREMSHYAV